ncbi:MAG: hypothetical protein KDB18_11640 [Salinibacterium sp.]|nr:hypothetical protein [Salinibacterium sp.]
MIVKVGTYTGSRPNSLASDVLRVSLGFVPDLVIVIPRNASECCWLNNSAWHGRTQFFHSKSSAYIIQPYFGRVSDPFTGSGFSVRGAANTASVVYDYIAVADNGSGLLRMTSWIGNNDTGRAIDWLESTADLVMVKRDAGDSGGRPMIVKANGVANNGWLDYQLGNSSVIASLTSTGITVTNSVAVNENDPPALGEGIEGLAWYESDNCRVISYTGDGNATQAVDIEIEGEACLVIDMVNDATASSQLPAWVTANMSADNSKPVDETALDTSGKISGISGSTLTVGSEYNVTGRAYLVLVLKSASGTQTVEQVKAPVNATALALDSNAGYAQLPSNSIGAAHSYMVRVRPRGPDETPGDEFFPLVFFGDGTDQVPTDGADDYNAGCYLALQDPDSNGWRGVVIRTIHSNYMRESRTSATLNSYDRNTGHTVQPGRDILIHVTKSAAGHDRIYIDGRLVKDYRLTAAIAALESPALDVGGTGTEKNTWLGAYVNDAEAKSRRASSLFHRVAWWDSTELTPAQVASHARRVLYNETYVGPAATQDIDFSRGAIPAGVTVTDGELVSVVDTTDLPTESAFVGVSASTINTTSHTASGIIPAAGTYIVGVMTYSGTDHRDVTALTVAGEAVTLAEATQYAGETTVVGSGSNGYTRVEYFLVDATAAGSVVATYNTTTLFANISVWRVTTPTAAASGAIASPASNAGSNTVGLTSLSGRNLLCVMGLFTGGASGAPSGETRFGRDAWLQDYRSVGASSRVECGEGWTGGQSKASVSHTIVGNAFAMATAVLAVPQPSVETAEFYALSGTSGSMTPVYCPPIMP